MCQASKYAAILFGLCTQQGICFTWDTKLSAHYSQAGRNMVLFLCDLFFKLPFNKDKRRKIL